MQSYIIFVERVYAVLKANNMRKKPVERIRRLPKLGWENIVNFLVEEVKTF